jgi:hypothetical protein
VVLRAYIAGGDAVVDLGHASVVESWGAHVQRAAEQVYETENTFLIHHANAFEEGDETVVWSSGWARLPGQCYSQAVSVLCKHAACAGAAPSACLRRCSCVMSYDLSWRRAGPGGARIVNRSRHAGQLDGAAGWAASQGVGHMIGVIWRAGPGGAQVAGGRLGHAGQLEGAVGGRLLRHPLHVLLAPPARAPSPRERRPEARKRLPARSGLSRRPGLAALAQRGAVALSCSVLTVGAAARLRRALQDSSLYAL